MNLKINFSLAIFLIVVFLTFELIAAADTLTILHVNDTHSCLAPLAPRNPDLSGTQGGIARAASVIGLTKMTETNVLTLHAGDSFIGDMFFNHYFGAAEFQIMNMLGFDAMAVGNHEFDLTPAILDTACHYGLLPSGFPLLSANLILDDPSVQDLKNFIKPYIIKEFGSLRVGIFGLTTPTANMISQPAPVFVDTNIGVTAAITVQELNAQGCNIVILLSHLGEYYDEMIAAQVPGINLIIGGHDHYLYGPKEVTNPLGQTTWLVQAGSNYSHIGQTKLVLDNGTLSLASYQPIPLDISVPEEPTVKAAVDGMIAEIEAPTVSHFSHSRLVLQQLILKK
ncbi:MAG: metallophosphatase [Ignavibacteriaceae bacterium]|nr:metallophosphatase [Ignavibacteriaceae bacterium]